MEIVYDTDTIQYGIFENAVHSDLFEELLVADTDVGCSIALLVTRRRFCCCCCQGDRRRCPSLFVAVGLKSGVAIRALLSGIKFVK